MSVQALSWVLEESLAKGGGRLVLLALANHAGTDGSRTFPSVETLAREARMTRSGVQKALRRLEAEGHIRTTGRTAKGTIMYQILMGASVVGPPISKPAGGLPRAEKGPTSSARTNYEPTTEPSGKRARAPELEPPEPDMDANGHAARGVYTRLFELSRRRKLASKAYPTMKGVRAALDRHADKDVGKTVEELAFWVEFGNGKDETIKSMDGRLETFLRRADKAPANGAGRDYSAYDRIEN